MLPPLLPLSLPLAPDRRREKREHLAPAARRPPGRTAARTTKPAERVRGRMNIFRFLGDMAHIVSFILLLHKIVRGKSAAGISLRTQEMYAGSCHL